MKKTTTWIVIIALIVIAVIAYRISTREGAPPVEESVTANDIRVIETRLDMGRAEFGTKITPIQLLEDSRCPQGAQCAQAGTLRVRARVTSEERKFDDDVSFTLFVPQFVSGQLITLVSVTPEPKAGKQIKENDYRFNFAVKR